MTAGLVGLAVGLRRPYARLAAEYLCSELATVSDDGVGLLLARLADLGEPGIPVLVDALGSPRESVAKAAHQMLSEQLNRWQNLSGDGGAEKQVILAGALANRVLEFGPTARSDAAELAGRILLWLPDSAVADRGRTVGCCEKVLRAGQVGRNGTPRPPLPPSSGSAAECSQRRGELLPPEMTVAELAPLPGGGLPLDWCPSPAAGAPEKADEEPSSAAVPATQPQLLATPSGARPLGPLRPPRLLSGVPDNAPGPCEARIPADEPPDAGEVRRLSAADVRGGAEGVLEATWQAEQTAAETIALMRRLRAKDQSQAAEARAELLRRGFGAVHLDLARRLFDPDPAVRQELARALPGLQSVDAVPWLLWLGCDEDPEVRLVAITLLATTGDAALRAEIEKLTREDPDPRIQELAERIGRIRPK
jgi:hypothetical protein